jgi:hypothetical protein
MVRNGAITIAAAILLLVLGLGALEAGASGRLPFQVLLNGDGSGHIFMNDGSSPSWKVCRPDLTDCTPFASGNLTTYGAPAGSVFWAGGELVTPLWKGNLRSVGPPAVQGKVRGNEVVTPVAGQWEGGWETDYDDLSLSICKTASDKRCFQVNHEEPRGRLCGPDEAMLIDPAFAGRYLRVVDHRYGKGTVFAGVGHPPYYPLEIEPSATVAVAIVGRIAPAIGPPKMDCGPPPLFDASITDDGSARVNCTLIGCRAALTARCHGRSARAERKLPASRPYGTASATLRLRPSSIERLVGCRARETISINGRVIAHRSVHLGPLRAG